MPDIRSRPLGAQLSPKGLAEPSNTKSCSVTLDCFLGLESLLGGGFLGRKPSRRSSLSSYFLKDEVTRLKEGWFRGGRGRSFQERQTVPRKGSPQGWAQAGALLWPEFRIL